MAWQMRSRARWEEALNIQKRRLGKHLKDVNTALSFDTFDIYIKDLEEERTKRGLGRLFKPDVLDQIKEFTGTLNSFSQVNPIGMLLWGSIQAVLKTAYAYVDTMAVTAEMITDMAKQLPHFEEYRSLFEQYTSSATPYENFPYTTLASVSMSSYSSDFVVRLTFGSLRRDFAQAQVQISKTVATFHTHVDIARTRLGVRAHHHIIDLTEASLRRQTMVKGVPFHRNFNFQGREAVLDDLHKKLRPKGTEKSNTSLSQTSCTIHGIGGVGKTQVALEYTYRYREDYAYIFWVRAESSIEISTSFASFARSLMPASAVQDQGANIQLVRDWMIQNDRWLIVFDNADGADLDLSLYWPPSSHGAIIITTQRRAFSHWAATNIHLDTFNDDDGARLILDVVDEAAQSHSQETYKMAQDISIELGGLPLLLSHVAGYVEGTKAPLSSIIENLKQPSEFKRIWGYGSTTSTNFQYKEPMAKVWRLALSALKPEALQILHIMAMLSPDEVFEDMLFGEWENADLSFLAESRRFEFNEVRQSLIDRHLIAAASDMGRVKLSMHKVFKRHILQRIDDEGDGKLSLMFKRAVAMVRRQFPKADELQTPTSETVVECEKCLPHVLSLVSIFQDWAPKIDPTFDFATLLADTGTNYMWERGLSADAVAILDLGARVCVALSHLETINPVHADICAIAGSVHETIGLSGRAAALEECDKALKLREERLKLCEGRGEAVTRFIMLQLANAWNDVGFVKLSYGDFEAALHYFLESYRIKQEHATEDHIPWHYGETFKNLALVKLHQGDKTGAEEAARRSCELCCQGRLETDASTQKARSLLGIVLMNTDKVDEALGLHKGVYNVRKEILGETNLHTKNTLYLIAELYRLKGKLVKAEDNFRLVLKQCELCWSDEAVARAKYHLALVIQARTDQLDATRRIEAEELINNARKTLNKLAPSPGNTLDAEEELERFDFLVSLLAGRWIRRK